ncbi:MAG TPA: crossover junction endodeoxyribonuclease RuvC [Candidatus Acidoferrales bacterium]|nr:crossover junction endodeoxyribonuclease RuvC [Candidatus Acidoferrales bacterium]
MTKKKTDRILAIDPGTQNMGFAVFNGKTLVHYGVATIMQRNSSREILTEGRKIIKELLDDFHPSLLVVEKTLFANNKDSAVLNEFTKEIVAIGRKKRIKTLTLSANTVRKEICGDGMAGKQEVATKMVEQFPELKPYLHSDRRWKEEFFYNMFDAVCLGAAALRRLE